MYIRMYESVFVCRYVCRYIHVGVSVYTYMCECVCVMYALIIDCMSTIIHVSTQYIQSVCL